MLCHLYAVLDIEDSVIRGIIDKLDYGISPTITINNHVLGVRSLDVSDGVNRPKDCVLLAYERLNCLSPL